MRTGDKKAIAVVTGSSTGIGQATTATLARAGFVTLSIAGRGNCAILWDQTQRGHSPGIASMSGEQWVEWGALTDDEWVAYVRENSV